MGRDPFQQTCYHLEERATLSDKDNKADEKHRAPLRPSTCCSRACRLRNHSYGNHSGIHQASNCSPLLHCSVLEGSWDPLSAQQPPALFWHLSHCTPSFAQPPAVFFWVVLPPAFPHPRPHVVWTLKVATPLYQQKNITQDHSPAQLVLGLHWCVFVSRTIRERKIDQ